MPSISGLLVRIFAFWKHFFVIQQCSNLAVKLCVYIVKYKVSYKTGRNSFIVIWVFNTSSCSSPILLHLHVHVSIYSLPFNRISYRFCPIGTIVVVIVWLLDFNYLCNQCLSSLEFESSSWRGVLDIILCDKVCQWLAAGQGFYLGTPVSSTNKTDCHDIAEILLNFGILPGQDPINIIIILSV